MNRRIGACYPVCRCVPHMRGDEPDRLPEYPPRHAVFPTCVGMNRLPDKDLPERPRVPHMRGDEPAHRSLCVGATACSPHAWG